MKRKKSSLVKKIKTSLESDDFGFGSYFVPLENIFKREVKTTLCPVEGIVYY